MPDDELVSNPPEAERNRFWRAADDPRPAPYASVSSWTGRHRVRSLLRELLVSVNGGLSILLAPFSRRRIRLALLSVALLGALWASDWVHSALASAGQSVLTRAAFTWEESFDEDLAHWIDSSALLPAGEGAVRVQGLALHSKSMTLTNYEMNFSACPDKRSIGWVVRAANPGNYYVFKLTERSGKSAGPDLRRFDFVRYAVLDGRTPPPSERQVFPLLIRLPEKRFLDISVRVTDDQILTLVNGFGVDTWKHPKIKSGGVGFVAEQGESFLVRSLTISGNDDFLGVFLRGAEETLRSVRRNLASRNST